MDLKEIVSKLEQYAPLNTATHWDNVGLLTEPTEALIVRKILVCNDLTEPGLFILQYHIILVFYGFNFLFSSLSFGRSYRKER